MPAIAYRLGNDVDVETLIDVYKDSGLEGRPVDDRESMRKMLAAANLVVSAWDGETLIGVARSLSDFVFCTYLSDLAVRRAYQRQGIGRELVRRTQKGGGSATVFLFAADAAKEYYERIGFDAGSGWYLPRMKRVR
jgi:ribosomal protein S18 acetylase RimI-like enzyme